MSAYLNLYTREISIVVASNLIIKIHIGFRYVQYVAMYYIDLNSKIFSKPFALLADCCGISCRSCIEIKNYINTQ